MSVTSALDRPQVGMISLGCAKNLVDAEIMLGSLQKEGYPITNQAEEADILIVNTCSFIDSAKEESIEAILEANRYKGLRKSDHAQKLIVAGCMAQRFSKELPESLPEVDAFIGLDQIKDIAFIVDQVWHEKGEKSYVTPRPRYIPDFDTPRLRLTPNHYAYVKIAEGCNHPCSFCIIPQMRGRHRSRTIESIVAEARALVYSGVKELILISQDTTYFGMDLWEERANPRQQVDSSRGQSLIHLLQELNAIEGDFWIRLLYTHPAHWSDELIETIAACPKVARYIDIPLQHIHEEMLHLMRRETSEQHIRDLITRLRKTIPDLAIRTTFIVGFPGETETHFKHLLQFIEETEFERLGIFTYSWEEGTRAYQLPNHISPETKQERFHCAMKLQKKLARKIQQNRIGTWQTILVDVPGIGRTQADAPEIDGKVFCNKNLIPGHFAEVLIKSATDYDLTA